MKAQQLGNPLGAHLNSSSSGGGGSGGG